MQPSLFWISPGEEGGWGRVGGASPILRFKGYKTTVNGYPKQYSMSLTPCGHPYTLYVDIG